MLVRNLTRTERLFLALEAVVLTLVGAAPAVALIVGRYPFTIENSAWTIAVVLLCLFVLDVRASEAMRKMRKF